MDGHVYKQIELTGSPKPASRMPSRTRLPKASKTLHDLRWFQIVESRGYIENGKQITIKLGFRLDE